MRTKYPEFPWTLYYVQEPMESLVGLISQTEPVMLRPRPKCKLE
jgi:hypothetical protein